MRPEIYRRFQLKCVFNKLGFETLRTIAKKFTQVYDISGPEPNQSTRLNQRSFTGWGTGKMTPKSFLGMIRTGKLTSRDFGMPKRLLEN
jgi:hypothetical protein